MTKSSSQTIQVTRKGLMIWIGLMLFISLWMFVLGIMVGRGTAPVNLEADKLEKELDALKAKVLKQEAEKVAAQVEGKSGETPELKFYEALKNPEKAPRFTPVKPVPPEPKPEPEPKPPPPAPRPEPPKPKPAPKPDPPKPAPAPTVKPAPEISAGKGEFCIQVASVQEIRGAEKLVAELRKKGYQAYQIRSQVPGKGIWYRIRVGAYNERAAAEKILNKLKKDKFNGMVVSNK